MSSASAPAVGRVLFFNHCSTKFHPYYQCTTKDCLQRCDKISVKINTFIDQLMQKWEPGQANYQARNGRKFTIVSQLAISLIPAFQKPGILNIYITETDPVAAQSQNTAAAANAPQKASDAKAKSDSKS